MDDLPDNDSYFTVKQDEYSSVLDDDLVGLVAKSGFREYFHPLTGRGHGTRSFSWSAALLIHVLVGSD